MKLYLMEEENILVRCNLLQSFYTADETTEKIIPMCKHFMLDSGAFSFLNGTGKKVDWDGYVERYADFIKKNRVQLYLELDIDPIVGYPKVLELRRKLEKLVGWPCIPVWHKSRGIEEFYKMCDQYDYVAVGGIVTKEIKPKDYPVFTHLIKEAHKRGAKIHGLGFTNLEGIKKYHFDSVDSTAWVSGNRFGHIYRFNEKTMIMHKKPSGARIKSRETALNNFVEWRKFCDYAEIHFKFRCMKIQPA